MKKKGRGCVEECTTLVCGQRVWAVKYFEKRCVMFLTTYASVLPLVEKQKYDSKERKKVPIQVPAVVDIYNSHMGGVDRLDHIIALYRSWIRLRKFYHKIFFHFVDMMCATAWREYREDAAKLGCFAAAAAGISLLNFKTEIAEAFCKQGKTAWKRNGRPSCTVEQDFEAKRKRGPAKPILGESVRKDQVTHFPEFVQNKGRCKMPGCKGITKVFCSKCKLNLCFTPKSNCFLKFHTQ